MGQISTRDQLLGFQDGITLVDHSALSKGTIHLTHWGRIRQIPTKEKLLSFQDEITVD